MLSTENKGGINQRKGDRKSIMRVAFMGLLLQGCPLNHIPWNLDAPRKLVSQPARTRTLEIPGRSETANRGTPFEEFGGVNRRRQLTRSHVEIRASYESNVMDSKRGSLWSSRAR